MAGPEPFSVRTVRCSAAVLASLSVLVLVYTCTGAGWLHADVLETSSAKSHGSDLYRKLEGVASYSLPSWRSMVGVANRADAETGWTESAARLKTEVKARLDEEVPLPHIRPAPPL